MMRLVVITMLVSFLAGCTVVKPLDRAALKSATQLANNNTHDTVAD